jgi:twinkle protein
VKLNLVRKPKTESKLIKHIACDACGSSDANGLYDDNHTYCFSCNTYYNETDADELSVMRDAVAPRKQTMLEIKGQIKAIPDRGITQQTCEKYGVTQENGQHFYPYTDDAGTPVAAKLRRVADKTFSILGTFTNARLFGQQLFHAGGKAVTITE